MKTRSLFWTLLIEEWVFRCQPAGLFVGMTLLWWGCLGALPLVPFYGDAMGQGNFLIYFEAGVAPIIGSQILCALSVWMAIAIIPALSQIFSPASGAPAELPRVGAFEFIFTRAVNRQTILRAKTGFWIIGLTPLYLNVLMSPLAPEVHLLPSVNHSAAALHRAAPYRPGLGDARLERYLKVFPTNTDGAIPHGAVAFCAWLAWIATLAGFFFQSYSLLIAPLVKPNNAWTALYAAGPLLLLLCAVVVESEFFRAGRNLCEDNFLFFAGHPLPMIAGLFALAALLQIWGERRFSQLELL